MNQNSKCRLGHTTLAKEQQVSLTATKPKAFSRVMCSCEDTAHKAPSLYENDDGLVGMRMNCTQMAKRRTDTAAAQGRQLPCSRHGNLEKGPVYRAEQGLRLQHQRLHGGVAENRTGSTVTHLSTESCRAPSAHARQMHTSSATVPKHSQQVLSGATAEQVRCTPAAQGDTHCAHTVSKASMLK